MPKDVNTFTFAELQSARLQLLRGQAPADLRWACLQSMVAKASLDGIRVILDGLPDTDTRRQVLQRAEALDRSTAEAITLHYAELVQEAA